MSIDSIAGWREEASETMFVVHGRRSTRRGMPLWVLALVVAAGPLAAVVIALQI